MGVTENTNISASLPVELTELDKQIWAEELKYIIPQKIFDVHVHLYLRKHIF